MIDQRTRAAIEATDTDELLRVIDRLCGAAGWDDLAELRRFLAEAVGRGKQLWGVDEHIRYRLALEAPGRWAAAAVNEGRTRFTIGPLPEVAASRHRWDELEPYLDQGPARALVAHERVVRGEDLAGAGFDRMVLELPPASLLWEPTYPVAIYHSDRADFPTPELPEFTKSEPTPAPEIDDPDTVTALVSLVTAWVDESNGRAQAVAVEGDAGGAVARLGARRVGMARIDPASALAWMSWAGASGGAHGSRPGAAAGRFAAWWAGAALAGMDWPPEPVELGQRLGEMGWYAWTDGATAGWNLRLAIEDPDEGLAWAIIAADAA